MDSFLKIYYSDGHSEIVNHKIQDFKCNSQTKGYKKPILIDGQYLYPTKNSRDDDCLWIDLNCVLRNDRYSVYLLKQKGVYDISVKMLLKNDINNVL